MQIGYAHCDEQLPGLQQLAPGRLFRLSKSAGGNLSFKHHAEVAALPQDDAPDAADSALRKGVSALWLEVLAGFGCFIFDNCCC